MYFTRNAYIDGKLQFDSEEILKTVKLQIYEAKADGEKWGSVKSLPFNNESYGLGHPSLSQDGTGFVLYIGHALWLWRHRCICKL